MSLWRLRKRVLAEKAAVNDDQPGYHVLEEVLDWIDEEMERDAEEQFTRPINPDPVTRQAKELKQK